MRHKERAAASSAQVKTFEDCAKALIASHEASWRNAKHRAQWNSTLATYAYPKIGNLPVSVIDTGLVMKVLQPIWGTKPETAGRVRGRIEAVLNWAKVSGYRDGPNPALWRGHLDQLLPPKTKVRKVVHHAAVPYRDMGTFMPKLRDHASMRPLRLLPMALAPTASRFIALPSSKNSRALGRQLTYPPHLQSGTARKGCPGQFAVIQSVAPSQGVDVSPINLGDAVVAQIIRSLTFAAWVL